MRLLVGLLFLGGLLPNPIDARDLSSTEETLFNRLKLAQCTGVIVGHHNANIEGVGWKVDGISDVYQITQKHVGLVGFDFLYPFQKVGQVNMDIFRDKIVEAHEQGSVVSIGWHAYNPLTGKDFRDTTKALDQLLPGAPLHKKYRKKLHQIASLMKSLEDKNGDKIPVIFRPFHEHNGHWFWWSNSNEKDFVALWRFTIDYLRKEGVQNMLVAYSPDKFTTKSQYFYKYPGDDYVDVLGLDYYAVSTEYFLPQLEKIVRWAEEKNKIPGLTETGVEKVPYKNYWTERFLDPIKKNPATRCLSFAMLWRNDNPNHHYAPYPGHASVENFIEFFKDPFSIFAGEF